MFIAGRKGSTPQGRATQRLTVRLLVTGASRRTTELLRLAAPGIGHQQASVVGQKDLLDLLLSGFVHVLLVPRYDSLGEGLTDGVHLRDVTTAPDPDVHAGELVRSEEEDGLEDLVPQYLRLNELNGRTIDLDQTTASLDKGDGDGGFLPSESLDALLGRGGRSGGSHDVKEDGGEGGREPH